MPGTRGVTINEALITAQLAGLSARLQAEVQMQVLPMTPEHRTWNRSLLGTPKSPLWPSVGSNTFAPAWPGLVCPQAGAKAGMGFC